MNYDVAIIGAGISGLTVAHDLAGQGLHVVVLERQQQVGGNAVSEQFNGFLMEHGPTTLNATVPQALALSTELGLDSLKQDLGEGVRKRYLLDQGKLHGIPVHPSGFLLSPYLSVRGRISMMAEILRPVKTDDEDETVHDFAVRRFGLEFAERIMDPLVAGMFGGEAHTTSLQGVFSKLRLMEKKHGSLIRATIRAAAKSEPGQRLFSFRDGVASLPKAIAANLKDQIKTGVVVSKITKQPSGFRIETANAGALNARAIVLATQPHVSAQLLEDIDSDAAVAASQVDAPPMAVVYFGWRKEQVGHRLDSLGVLATKSHDGLITGMQFPSTMFENRAPEGMVSISAYVGGTRNRAAAQIKPDELIKQVRLELSRLLDISGRPVVSRIRQWPRSLPQYELGHIDRIKPLVRLGERCEGAFVVGNYIGGVSMANCIATSHSCARGVASFLADRHNMRNTIAM